jgi:hypothetical protein
MIPNQASARCYRTQVRELLLTLEKLSILGTDILAPKVHLRCADHSECSPAIDAVGVDVPGAT